MKHIDSVLRGVLVASCLVLHSMVGFCSAYIPTKLVIPRNKQLIFPLQSTKSGGDSQRAGADGYSLLRQPAAWNVEEDPEFDMPQALREEDDIAIQEDTIWWTSKQSPVSLESSGQMQSETTVIRTEESMPKVKAEDKLDLYQRSFDTLDFGTVLRFLQKECATLPAQKMVHEGAKYNGVGRTNYDKVPKKFHSAYRSLVAHDVDGVQDRYRAVQEMEWLLSNGNGQDVHLEDHVYRNRKGYKEPIGGRGPPFYGRTFNLEAVLAIADQGKVLEGAEILNIADIMNGLEDIVLWGKALEKVQELEFIELPTIVSIVEVNATLQELLQSAFDKNGKLCGNTFPAVGQLRQKVRALKADIMGTLDSLLTLPSMQSKLALESGGPLYSEVSGGRLVIPVEPKYASSVGIVHDSSRSEKTVYVEPTEIIGPTNELRQAEAELRKEEAKVWRSLTEQILNNRIQLEASVSAVGQIDLTLARLMLGRKIQGVIPMVKNEGVISLQDAKHPVLLLRELENVVGSDIDLGADGNQGLVLTGPNSGGKTVILKLLGLIALMVRSGIPVPSQKSAPRVDFFDPVLADIGDIQSVDGDLSTFSGHMLVCREILSNSGENALVLMDELGSGTDPNQGVAIAQAVLEALLETGARVAITTHYLQLKQLAASDNRFSVAGMQFVKGKPTYKLLPGTVGESFALAVAERLELPKSVISRANDLLDSETRQMGDLIRELEDQRGLVAEQQAELETKKKEMLAMEIEIKEEKIRLEKKQLTARRDEAKKFAKKLEEKESVLQDILEKLKKDPSQRILAKSWDDIKFVRRDALTEAEYVPSVLARMKEKATALEEAREELVPIGEMREKPDFRGGEKLVVCKAGALFGREAIVVSSQKRQINVQVSGMAMTLKLDDVAFPAKNGSFNKGGNNKANGGRRAKMSKVDRALMLEGTSPSETRTNVATTSRASKVMMRTESNTVDVRGCNLEEAKSKAKSKFSSSLMSGRPVVYILHGHGTGGVLKTKIRGWLRNEKSLVKKYGPADAQDGGDAFTRVELQ